ncbi:MAG: pantoate--beta-alanine ligase [Planctomycetota bacterium]|nr:pantoate--beta-alanine ligase [Planctomycetota bacterium]
MALQRIDDPTRVRELCAQARAEGRSVGIVPTMGALHVGHLALVARAKAENDLVVVSVFVNPLQFDKEVDLVKYPRDIEGDAAGLATVGCDILVTGVLCGEGGFFPECSTAEEIPVVDAGPGAAGLEGEHRVGHFDGVATIIHRLFEVACANRAYFGAKDFQQTLVAEHVARGLNAVRPELGLEIVVCATTREPSGLARSSRNLRLSPAGRRAAAALSFGLWRVRQAWRAEGVRDPRELERRFAEELESASARLGGDLPPIEVEYAAVRDPGAWSAEVATRDLGEAGVALTAAWVEGVRLIDNLMLSGPALAPELETEHAAKQAERIEAGEEPGAGPEGGRAPSDLRPGEEAVVVVAAPAKVNPWLAVLGKRDDGFHEVELGMLALDLEDELRLAWQSEPGTLELRIWGPAASADIPADSSNLVHRAAVRGLAELDGLPPGHLVVELHKRIPSQAGLGGGSSDAAAALLGVLELGRLLGAKPRTLAFDAGSATGTGPGEAAIAAALASFGSDCPFFFTARHTGFAICRGRGERVAPRELAPGHAFAARALLVVTPNLACPTAGTYAALAAGRAAGGDAPAARGPLSTEDPPFNDLEPAAFAAAPDLATIAARLATELPAPAGASDWLLSGSGSSLFQWQAPGATAAELDERRRLAAALCEVEPRHAGLHRASHRGVRVLAVETAPQGCSQVAE